MDTPGGEDAKHLDSAKRVSPARTTAKENICTGKEKGHREDGGMNVADQRWGQGAPLFLSTPPGGVFGAKLLLRMIYHSGIGSM